MRPGALRLPTARLESLKPSKGPCRSQGLEGWSPAEPRPVMNHQAEPRSHQVSLWPSIMQQALGFSLKASSSAALSSSASPRASVYPWKGAKTHLTVFFLKTLGMEPGTSNTLPAPGQY